MPVRRAAPGSGSQSRAGSWRRRAAASGRRTGTAEEPASRSRSPRRARRSPASPQDGEGARLHLDRLARREGALLRVRLGGREIELPPRAEPPRRELEGDGLVVCVEEQQERLVAQRLAAGRGV